MPHIHKNTDLTSALPRQHEYIGPTLVSYWRYWNWRSLVKPQWLNIGFSLVIGIDFISAPNNGIIFVQHRISCLLKNRMYFLTSSNNLINLIKYSSFKLKYIWSKIGPYTLTDEQIILVQCFKPLLGQWNFNIGLILGQDCNVAWVT